MSYQPAISSYLTTSGSISVDSDHQHLIEELRRDVTELRVQLEREKQRRSLLEQSYSYYNSFVQAAQQSVAAISNGHIATTPPSLQPSLITPPNSRHSSTEELQDVISVSVCFSAVFIIWALSMYRSAFSFCDKTSQLSDLKNCSNVIASGAVLRNQWNVSISQLIICWKPASYLLVEWPA